MTEQEFAVDVAERTLWLRLVHETNRQRIPFDILLEDFRKLIYEPCHYCGSAPSSRYRVNATCTLQIKVDDVVHGYVIPIEPRLGIVHGNAAPACDTCRQMKGMMGEEEFIEHCWKVSGGKQP